MLCISSSYNTYDLNIITTLGACKNCEAAHFVIFLIRMLINPYPTAFPFPKAGNIVGGALHHKL